MHLDTIKLIYVLDFDLFKFDEWADNNTNQMGWELVLKYFDFPGFELISADGVYSYEVCYEFDTIPSDLVLHDLENQIEQQERIINCILKEQMDRLEGVER